MIHIDDSAQHYFGRLIAQQAVEGLCVRIKAVQAGTPNADCKLEFCEPEDINEGDLQLQLDEFSLIVDPLSAPYLEDAQISYQSNATGGELTIKAPRLKGKPPADGAGLSERVQYVLDAEINPGVASHGGKVSLVEVTEDGVVVLRFGGGCQGCGNVDLTLRGGIEKTLKTRLPEITGVRDVTDHASGTAPYIRA
jgi:Fe/S biogenesis protein NfuA